MAGVKAEEKCFLTLEKVLPNQFDDHYFITQPSSDTTFLIPNPDTANISDFQILQTYKLYYFRNKEPHETTNSICFV